MTVPSDRGLLPILAEIRSVGKRLAAARATERAFVDATARAEVAAQVAHDIRSPLAALRVASSDSSDEGLTLLRAAVERIEAIPNVGTVDLRLSGSAKEPVIEIRDDGNGIPSDIVSRLTKKGVSFGKSTGRGLGLFHARRSIERWSGSLHIESREGAGTTVLLKFPASETSDAS